MSKYARFDPENKKAHRKKDLYLDETPMQRAVKYGQPRKAPTIGRFHKREMLGIDAVDEEQK